MPDQAPPLLTLLEGVSRSFYLSVRLLPAGLRQPVAVGYLLARASDTLADAPGAPAGDRLSLLEGFEAMVRGDQSPRAMQLAAAETNDERQLLESLPACIAALEALPAPDRDDVRTVLRHITRGQRLDVERFGAATPSSPVSLASDEELDEYTYLVAGCVGEFWTRLGFRHVESFANLPEAEMLELGRRYGMALQLVNVLRDMAADIAIGRRYVPGSTTPWESKAREGLGCGLRYSVAVNGARVRMASALPALIGVRMLGRGMAKVRRSEVRGLMLRLALSLGSRSRIEREFAVMDNRPR